MFLDDLVRDYVRIISNIARCKSGDEFSPTPYILNLQRMDIHEKLWNELSSGLSFADGFTVSDGFYRSKEIFSNLDKVFLRRNAFPLDLTNNDCVLILIKDLCSFLMSRETQLFLEGKISNITGVIEDDV